MTDLLAFLHATLDAAEALALATTDGQPYDEWTAVVIEGDSDAARSVGEVACIAHRAVTTPANRAIMQHIAANDPAAVLRRIAADRKQLELHAAVPDHGRFSERDCPPLCDGDHDEPPVCQSCRTYAGDPIEAPCPTVEILAEGWGWTGETP